MKENRIGERMSESLQHDSNVVLQSSPERASPLFDVDALSALTAAAESLVDVGDDTDDQSPRPRNRLVDSSGSELCVICRDRLNRRGKAGRVKPYRRHGDGHAHDSCIRNQTQSGRKRNSMEANFDNQDEGSVKRQRRKDIEQHDARQRAATTLAGINRALKPCSDLHRSQRTSRNAILTDVLQGLCMTLEDLIGRLVLSPDKCAAYDNHQLKALREVFPIPSHTTINKERKRWAEEYGCGTEAFTTEVRGESKPVHVAYITDPMTLLNHFETVTANITHWRCVVGLDKGGDLTTLGITYPTDRLERGQVVWDYCPFILSTAGDDWDGLCIMESDQFHFTGHSRGFSNYCQVFQKILNDRNGLFCADWNGTNATFGYSTASASHPCFACTVHLRNLLTIAPPRTDTQVALNTLYVLEHPSTVPNMNLSMVRLPHLTLPCTNIVPTPLHVFLGLCNRLVNSFERFTSVEFISNLKAEARGHAQVTGLSDIRNLNGPQLSKWIKRGYVNRVVEEYLRQQNGTKFPVSTVIRIRKAGEWMKELHDYLLHRRTWTEEDVMKFGQLKDSMWRDWTKITGDGPIPKLHMLQHCVEFAARHRVLGRYSEAQLESSHADANRAFEKVHMNVIHKPLERLRRTLVTLVTKQLSPRRTKRSQSHTAA